MELHTFTTEEGVLTTAKESEYGDQSIVDSKYSNVWTEHGYIVIADHNTQDFAKLSLSDVGSTGTYDGKPLICTGRYYGVNDGHLKYNGARFYCKDDILTYTCSGLHDGCVWLLTWRYDKEMNEQELRNKLISRAVSYLGYNESDGSHKLIIDAYNAHRPLARGYAVKYTDEWCATFVSAMSIMCGFTEIAPTECGCEKMIMLYKSKGRWCEDESITPEPGDIIFYDWGDTGVGDCTGTADHVGIVVSVGNGNIKVIEGNTSGGKVAYRNIAVNARYIRGYAKPDYASLVTELDIGECPDWAVASATKAVRKGIVHGYGDGEYGWVNNLTRAEMVVILDNLGLMG